MTVYVRWYGKVLEGELLDGEAMGMKQVRIPLDGHRPIALFAPGHIYETEERAAKDSPKDSPIIPRTIPALPDNYQKSAINDVLPSDDRQSIEAFKQANWNYERGHLRIDKLDEFYQLWRMAMVPFGFVEAEAAPKRETPKPEPQPRKPVKKDTPVQLSLFD